MCRFEIYFEASYNELNNGFNGASKEKVGILDNFMISTYN